MGKFFAPRMAANLIRKHLGSTQMTITRVQHKEPLFCTFHFREHLENDTGLL